MYAMLVEAHEALSVSLYPKILFVGDPGALVSPAFAERIARGLKNCRVVHLGPGTHYLQEDHPEVIGKSVAEWIRHAEGSVMNLRRYQQA